MIQPSPVSPLAGRWNQPGNRICICRLSITMVYAPAGASVSVGLPGEPGAGAADVWVMVRRHVPARPAGGAGGAGTRARTSEVALRPPVAVARTAKRCLPGVSQDVTR